MKASLYMKSSSSYLCAAAEIDAMTEGNLNDLESKKYGKGIYPKWMLVSSYICRRSFATNFYAEEDYLPNVNVYSRSCYRSDVSQVYWKKPMKYGLQ
jgi:hypothetical protein